MLAVSGFKDVMASLWSVVMWIVCLGVWVFGLAVAWRLMRAIERIASAMEARGSNKT